jgi:hypothetical protein
LTGVEDPIAWCLQNRIKYVGSIRERMSEKEASDKGVQITRAEKIKTDIKETAKVQDITRGKGKGKSKAEDTTTPQKREVSQDPQ